MVHILRSIKIKKLCIMMGLIIALTACSSTRLIYTLAKQFIKDEVNYFIDLNPKEKEILSMQISEMINWHRKFILPKYSAYLTSISNKLEAGEYSLMDITKILSKGRYLIEETVTGLTPRASKILILHQKDEEIDFMEKKMEMRRKERKEELSKPYDELYEKRLDKLTSNFERFFGTLTDAQSLLIKEYTVTTQGDSKIRLLNRTKRQKAFLDFLRTQPTEMELTSYLNKLLLRGHTIINPTYKTFSETSLKRFQELIEAMLAISTTSQRFKIIKKLRIYAEDFKNFST